MFQSVLADNLLVLVQLVDMRGSREAGCVESSEPFGLNAKRAWLMRLIMGLRCDGGIAETQSGIFANVCQRQQTALARRVCTLETIRRARIDGKDVSQSKGCVPNNGVAHENL